MLKKFYQRYQTTSSALYIQKQTEPAYATIISLFGSWNNFIREADFEPPIREVGGWPAEFISKENILQLLQTYFACDSKLIFLHEYEKSGLEPSGSTVASRFGTWRNAMIQLGIDMNRKGLLGRSKNRYEVAEEVVQEAKSRWGKTPEMTV